MAENRGGHREPTPGRLYANRRDLATQPAQAPKGQGYGGAKRLIDAQRKQPIAGSPTAQIGLNPGGQLPALAPGDIPSLDDPSAYPDEPVTTGLASGPGAGPESLLTGPFGSESLSLLRTVYSKFPNEDIRRLIEQTEVNL